MASIIERLMYAKAIDGTDITTGGLSDAFDQTYGAPVPVANLTILATLSEAILPDGYRVYVTDLRTDYTYKAAATSGDVAPNDQTSGTGFWVETRGAGRGGYEFTAAWDDYNTDVDYTSGMIDNDQWLRFGFTATAQSTNDSPWWPNFDDDAAYDGTKGFFGGLHLPPGVSSLFNFDDAASDAAVTGQSLNYTAVTGGGYDLSETRFGDWFNARVDFEVTPQISGTTLELALIFTSVDQTSALTATPIFLGDTASVGQTSLLRPVLNAFIVSSGDQSANAYFAVKANNPVKIKPLSTLATILR